MQSRRLPTVLGLCAPNSKLMEQQSHRNSSRFSSRQGKPAIGLDFPFHLASCSNETPAKARVRFKHPDPAFNGLQHEQKTVLSPFASVCSLFLYTFSS